MYAHSFADYFGSKLTIAHAAASDGRTLSPEELQDEITGIAKINPDQVRAILTRPELMSCEQMIQVCKNESADLIIVSENYRQKPGAFFHGSPLEKLVHQSPCPVMIVPGLVDPVRLKE